MRKRSKSERGQALALMVVALVALLGTAALVMDVGFAWYAKRQVQASADAAALAGAQELPNVTSATSTALDYYSKNRPNNLSSSPDPAITFGCAPSGSYICSTGIKNTIQVIAKATTPAWFGSVFGFDHFSVGGTATACQPCSSSPVDVMLVIDRTGSMCDHANTGAPSGTCGDLDNAKNGVKTLLSILDPSIDRVGLVAFPGYLASDPDRVCGNDQASAKLTINGVSVTPNNYDAATAADREIYLDDPLSNDFKTSASATTLNPASPLVQQLRPDVTTPDLYGKHNCIQSMGSTSYADALQAGKAELDKDGRPDVPHIIVFMTDGEANMGSYQPGLSGHELEPDLGDPSTGFDMPGGIASTWNPGDAQPCHTAINVANAIKADKVTIYSIGYALGNASCVHGVWGQIDKSYASDQNDWQDFRCETIGTPITGPNADKSWAKNATGIAHYQGIYSKSPANGGNNTNPCTNDPNHTHIELPAITSSATVQAIASPGNFYSKPAEGQLKTIFAAIAADITSGTSRLVDDNWVTGGS